MLGLGIVAALCGPAAAQDYAKYRVLDAKVIEDMSTSAGQRAALLSPDGSRVLHLNGQRVLPAGAVSDRTLGKNRLRAIHARKSPGRSG